MNFVKRMKGKLKIFVKLENKINTDKYVSLNFLLNWRDLKY